VPWYLRPLLAWQRSRHGRVLEPTAMWAWRPAPMLGFLALFSLLRRRNSPVPARLRALASVRVSQVADCAFCVDLNGAMLLRDGDAIELADLAGWRNAVHYTDVERLVLEYAEVMSATPPAVSDAMMTRLRAVFTPEAIVELTAVVALQNMSARFNNALAARAHGFCALPDPTRPAAALTTETKSP
jgi:AhpD family alkylhydroperoxidase